MNPDQTASMDQSDPGPYCLQYRSGDKNNSILHLSCMTSDLQFSLVLQTHVYLSYKAYTINNIREQYVM